MPSTKHVNDAIQNYQFQTGLTRGSYLRHDDCSEYCCMVCLKVAKKVNSKSSHFKEKKYLFFICLVGWLLCEVMDVNKIYCGNHFAIYVSQAIFAMQLKHTLLYVSDISIKLKGKHKVWCDARCVPILEEVSLNPTSLVFQKSYRPDAQYV